MDYQKRWNAEMGPKLMPVVLAASTYLEAHAETLHNILSLPESVEPWNIFAHFRLRRALELLNQMEAISSKVASVRKEMDDYIREVGGFLEKNESAAKTLACFGETKQHIRQLKAYEQKLDEFEGLRKTIDPDIYRDRVTMANEQASRYWDKLRVHLFAVLLLTAIFCVIYLCIRKYGEGRGRKELEARLDRNDIGSLLDFIVENPFSLKLNMEAISCLKRNVTPTAENLQKISNAASKRWGRGPGVLNNEVGNLLHQVYKGIENVVNREAPPNSTADEEEMT
jgi:hypothetical protein